MKKIQDDELQAKLDEAQQTQSAKHDTAQILKLEQKIAQLEAEKKEVEEIAKRSQFDYINLKTDFDRYQRQMQEAQKVSHTESLLAVVKKFLPFLEDLRKSLDNITEDHQGDPLTKGVHMIYEKFLKTLEHMHIKVIPSLGLEPDSFLHEPVSVQPVEEAKMKGKIIQEFERWFVYEHDGEKKVIIPAKVIVGN